MAAPNTMTPGQTNDPVWEDILNREWNKHGDQFGTDWHGSKTTDQERAGQLARMQAAYRNATAPAGGGGGGSRGGGVPAPTLYTPKLKDYMAEMEAPDTNAYMAKSGDIDPQSWQPDGAFVENRLEGILASDSPLMQRAQTEGMQYANSRGLLNSTMAAGAAQGAMIDRAMPIAQQDAQFVGDLNKMGLGHNLDLSKMGLAYEQDIQKMSHGHNLGLAASEFTSKLDHDSRAQLMQMEAQYARLLQYDNNAADAYKSMIGAIGMTNTNPNLSPEQQREATQQFISMQNSHLNFLNQLYR